VDFGAGQVMLLPYGSKQVAFKFANLKSVAVPDELKLLFVVFGAPER
jgi:hypothetical protein